MTCDICGREGDLFAVFVREPACSVCVITYGIPTPIRRGELEAVRARIGLGPGELAPRLTPGQVMGRGNS